MLAVWKIHLFIQLYQKKNIGYFSQCVDCESTQSWQALDAML